MKKSFQELEEAILNAESEPELSEEDEVVSQPRPTALPRVAVPNELNICLYPWQGGDGYHLISSPCILPQRKSFWEAANEGNVAQLTKIHDECVPGFPTCRANIWSVPT